MEDEPTDKIFSSISNCVSRTQILVYCSHANNHLLMLIYDDLAENITVHILHCDLIINLYACIIMWLTVATVMSIMCVRTS